MTTQPAPRLLPLTIGLIALLWVFTTVGGQHVFVRTVLGEAYDSQADHLLRGDPGVEGDAIQHEAIIVNGKARMYFGPFPALLRIPLNFLYPGGRGKWCLISVFSAGAIALSAFAGLVAAALRSTALSNSTRSWIGNTCVAGFAFGSPLLLLLGSPSIYNEAIVWGLAWALAALFFAWRCESQKEPASTWSLLGFSLCAAAALLSRVTFGLPLLFVALLLAVRRARENSLRRLAALLFPIGIGLTFYLGLSYARFGSFVGISFEHYINPVHRDFVRTHGMFNLSRLPFNFVDYFGLRFPAIRTEAPFLKVDRYFFGNTSFSSLEFSETYLPLPWCSGWLLLAVLFGILYLVRPDRSRWFERCVAAVLFTEFIAILSYFLSAQRYTADFYPFLIFCLAVFLRSGGTAVRRVQYPLVALAALSILVNSLSTISWLVDCDQNIPSETRLAWKNALQRSSPVVDPKRR